MKSSLLFVVFSVFAIHLSAQNSLGLLENSSFEDWETFDLWESPDSYFNSNDQEGFSMDSLTLIKSEERKEGNFSLKLQTLVHDSDTAIGYALNGAPNDSEFEGGIPFTTKVEFIKGWVKVDVKPTDTAFVLVVLKNEEEELTTTGFFTGTSNGWIEFSFPVQCPDNPDSLIVGFTSGNAFSESSVHGSTMYFDAIHFVNGEGEKIPFENGGFEDWSTTSYDEPEEWFTYNPFTFILDVFTVKQSEDANTGNYAVEISTIAIPYDNNEEDTLPGLLTNAVILNPSTIFPINYELKPTKLSSYVQFSPNGLDTASIQVLFYDAQNNIVGGGYSNIYEASTSYSLNEIDLIFIGEPKSVFISIFPGSNPGSTLLLDDIQFSGESVNIEENLLVPFTLYPNPTSNIVRLKMGNSSEKATVFFYDAMGRLALAPQIVTHGNTTVNLSPLSAGIYHYRIDVGNRVSKGKLIKN